MKFYILTQRNDFASPQDAGIFGFENVLAETCNANLAFIKARAVTRQFDLTFDSINFPNHYREFLRRNLIEKTIGLYEPTPGLPTTRTDDINVLFIVGISPPYITLLNSIKEWRSRFDIVAAFIYDAWLFDSYNQEITTMIDHLFVPVPSLVNPLESRFGINVSYLPHGADVIDNGSNNTNRSIDVASYGRIPSEYHNQLFESLNTQSNSFYYRQVPEGSQKYPDQEFGSKRFDYQHVKLLSKVLANSKISLAFDFTYTTKKTVELKNSQNHPSYRYPEPVLTPRWFEGLAAGCAIVGKRPFAPEVDDLLDWEDATIDVPDDLESGIELIMNLLKNQERLHTIHQRNYQEMLKRHDYRWRIRTVLERLGLPIPQKLNNQLEQCLSLADRKNYSN